MSLADLRPGELWSILTGLCSAGSVIYLWLTRRSNVTNETISKIENRIGDAETRLTTVEQAQAHSPTTDDLTAIRSDISNLAREVAGLAGNVKAELSGLNRQLGLIQEHLLNRTN